MDLLLIFSGTFFFLFFIWFILVSVNEKEYLAVKRALLLTLIIPGFYFLPVALSFGGSEILGWLLLIVGWGFVFMLLLPFKGRFKLTAETARKRYDERDTMFSRNEITHRPELQKHYYETNPDKIDLDKPWQEKPGLMSEKSLFYSAISFTAADASFFPIEQLRPFVDGDVNSKKKSFDSAKMTNFLSNWAKKLGAVSVGFCEMQDDHFYSVRGRGEAYGNNVKADHQYGIALTVEMDKDLLAAGPAGPTLMESAREYLNSGVIAIQLAKFIRELGYEARAHVDGNYELICPLVARDAGLGEIGRMGLLMTPELGPRVRIAVVTTNIPLEVTPRFPDYTVHSFCSICKKCADVCPGNAIPKSKIEMIDGVQRWQVNHEKCFAYWCTSGTDCGRCMSVCPYSHPDNLLHNMVRWGIKNNWLFRHFALKMDDFFYGRKPKPSKIPGWIDFEESDSHLKN